MNRIQFDRLRFVVPLIAAFFFLSPAHGQINGGFGGSTTQSAPGGGWPTYPGGGGGVGDPQPEGGADCDRPQRGELSQHRLTINGPSTACSAFNTSFSTSGTMWVTPQANTSVDVQLRLTINYSGPGGSYNVVTLDGAPYTLSAGSSPSAANIPIQFSGQIPILQSGTYSGYVSLRYRCNGGQWQSTGFGGSFPQTYSVTITPQVAGNFAVNGQQGGASSPGTTINLCPSDNLFLTPVGQAGPISGYSITVERTVNNVTSSQSLSFSGALPASTNLTQLFSPFLSPANATSMGLKVTVVFTAGGSCQSGQTITRVQYFNVVLYQNVFAYDWRKILPNQNFADPRTKNTTYPITTSMPTGTTTQTLRDNINASTGWVGAGTFGLLVAPNNTSTFTVKVYEIDVMTGLRMVRSGQSAPDIAIAGGTPSSANDLPLFNVMGSYNPALPPFFFEVDPNIGYNDYYFQNWYFSVASNPTALAEFSSRTYCIDVSITSPNGCAFSDKSYFRVANNGNQSGRLARQAKPEEESNILSEGLISAILVPNPAHDAIRVSVDGPLDNESRLTVFDPLGRKVLDQSFTGRNTDVDVRHFPSGSYIMMIQSGGTVHKEKFQKL